MQGMDRKEMGKAPIYISYKTRTYLRGLYKDMTGMKVDAYYVAWGSGVDRELIVDILQGHYHLNCKEFLMLSSFMGWQVKDTPNYIWYHMIYPPEEIARRLRRLNITSPSNLSPELQSDLRHMFDCFFGQYPKTPRELRDYLVYIRVEERKRGYDDYIKMEGKICLSPWLTIRGQDEVFMNI